MQALPWVRAADVWHVSSISDHKTVFKLNSAPPPQSSPSNINKISPPRGGNNFSNSNITQAYRGAENSSNSNETRTPRGAENSPNNNQGWTPSAEKCSHSKRQWTPRGDVCGDDSIGPLSVESSISNLSGSSVETARFRERVVGKTWSGFPAVILRSLRAPGSYEAACAARWLRRNGEDGGGVFGRDEDWSDNRLRLLADEWTFCTGLGLARMRRGKTGVGVTEIPAGAETAAILDPAVGALPSPQGTTATPDPAVGVRSQCQGDPAVAANSPPQGDPGVAAHPPSQGDQAVGVYSPPRERASLRPFKVHTGHIIVPFLNGRVREEGGDSVGHGVVLAVDRGFDWRRWEPYLVQVAAEATRCFERLENEGQAAEKARVKAWADRLLQHGDGEQRGREQPSDR